MEVAFDVDDTTTRYPDLINQLISYYGANQCVMLTGTNDMEKPYEEHKAFRLAQLRPLLKVVPHIHICRGPDGPTIARLKGEYCRDNKIKLFLDDNDGFCQFVRSVSPSTIVLKVMP